MATQPKARITPEAYLERERAADYKSEYFDGEIFAMSGASEPHNLIVTNVIGELRQQLKKRPCKVYPSDMRVKVNPSGLYTYPDVVIVCGESQFDDTQRDTLLNPTILIEVLSRSTEAYDRGKKFEHYRKIESLQEYILVSQTAHHLERYARQPNNQWLLSEASGLEATLPLEAIECELLLAEVYDKVILAEDDSDDALFMN